MTFIDVKKVRFWFSPRMAMNFIEHCYTASTYFFFMSVLLSRVRRIYNWYLKIHQVAQCANHWWTGGPSLPRAWRWSWSMSTQRKTRKTRKTHWRQTHESSAFQGLMQKGLWCCCRPWWHRSEHPNPSLPWSIIVYLSGCMTNTMIHHDTFETCEAPQTCFALSIYMLITGPLAKIVAWGVLPAWIWWPAKGSP